MNNGEEVGKISYAVEIDVSALRAGTKSAEQAIHTSFSASEQQVNKSTKNMEKSVNGAAEEIAALAGSILALRGVGNFLGSAIDSANKYQSAMIGLSTTARAFNQDQTAVLTAAQNLSDDGLIPLTQSAAALRNLLASGFSVQEATQLLSGLKDQAAFNRQSWYDLGGAVVATTEGIRNGNSVLADATGTTKNLSVMAKEAGVGIDQMGSIQSNTAYRTAVLNGFLQDTNRSLGDAARYSQTAAGADQRLSYEMEQLRIKVGSVANALRVDAIASLTGFIASNQDAIIAVGTSLAAMTAFAAGAYLLSRALVGLRAAMTLIATHPIVAMLTITVGLLSGLLVGKVLDKAAKGMTNMGNGANNAATGMKSLGDESKKLSKDLAKINRDYAESLAEIVKRHEDSIKELTAQIKAENANYNAAVRERLTEFQKEQGEEESAHALKVQKLQNQIDFLRKYNNASNRQQLTDLQFALARENAEYTKRNTERQAAYDADAEASRLGYEQQVGELQARLNTERAVLDKHAVDVASIRNVILLDEIDKLKRSRDEQILAARQAAAGTTSAWNNQMAMGQSSAAQAGDSMGTAFADAIKRAIQDELQNIANGLERFFDGLFGWAGDLGAKYQRAISGRGGKPSVPAQVKGFTFGSRAAGGPVSAGLPYFVGENPDGSLNRTSELFVPRTSGTIVPADEVQKALGGGSSAPMINITLNLSGVMSSGPSDERAIALRLIKRLNEVLRARGVPEIGVA